VPWQDQIRSRPRQGVAAPILFHADLHIHSRFSRACSKDCDLEHLSWWALRKGLRVLGTGDFTHPAWAAGTEGNPRPGRARPVPDPAGAGSQGPPATPRPAARAPSGSCSRSRSPRSTGATSAPGRCTILFTRLASRPRTGSPRRWPRSATWPPTAGRSSGSILVTCWTSRCRPARACFLVPAHVWTPWFAVLGSKSGFDAVHDCYADLAGHIFAVETGLSSDPPMNWACSSLDGYRLVSNSDAHSPPMLGREATVFDTELDYFSMAAALRTGKRPGGHGRVSFPRRGSITWTGHRKCGVRGRGPSRPGRLGTICPHCGKPLTVGVLHRVAELADRPAGFRPPGVAGVHQPGPAARDRRRDAGHRAERARRWWARSGGSSPRSGPELSILRDVPLDDLRRVGGVAARRGHRPAAPR